MNRILAAGLALVAGAMVLVAFLVTTQPSLSARDGRRLYDEGLMPDGTPTRAVVLGDVPVSGDQAQCASCHGRSGLGIEEGEERTPPVAGRMLFDLDRYGQGLRPGYTREALGRAVRQGIGSDGRPLDPLMPRYPDIDDALIQALADHLETIGRDTEPGQAEAGFVEIATVLHESVPAEDRQAIVDVLKAFARVHNEESWNGIAMRRAKGVTKLDAYRRWRIHTWTLTGPPATWRRQLEAQYRDDPVFGFVSGMVDGPWQPVHEFCVEHGLPYLLPITDEPVDDPTAGPVLYFSGGLRLEARAIADQVAGADIVQIVAPGDARAARAAAALDEVTGTSRTVEAADAAALASALDEPAGAYVLWMTNPPLDAVSGDGPPIFVSDTFTDPDALPEGVRSRAWVVSRRYLPGQRDAGALRFRSWALPRGVKVVRPELQAKAWYAALALEHALVPEAKSANRQYTLDALDHAAGLDDFVPIHPRAEFGRDVRTASKGAWVRRADGDGEPTYVIPRGSDR